MGLCFWYVYPWADKGEIRLLVCFFFIEMAIITIFAYNIIEATYAVKYPRAPLHQTTPSAATKSKSGLATSPTPKRAFKVLSPNVQHIFQFDLHFKSSNHQLVDQPSTAETFWIFSIFSYCCFHLFFALFN